MQSVPGPYGPRPVLSRTEVVDYMAAFAQGDAEAGRVLALSAAPLVKATVRKWRLDPGEDLDDLTQDAHLAVMLRRSFGILRSRPRPQSYDLGPAAGCVGVHSVT